MLDDKAYQDRAPFDVTTLEEGISSLAAERAGAISRSPLRRPSATTMRGADESAGANVAALAASSAEAGASPAERPAPDYVNHPPHYTAHPSGVECITITRHMNFNKGNAVKYIWRAGGKGNEIEDLRKAAWYINDEIARLEKLRDEQ